jgi:hypothetical protein
MLRLTPALLPAFSLVLSGCWPMIPGKWSDYDVPDETQIVGGLSYFEPQGGYWGDPDPSGNVAWGWLDTPQIGLQAIEPDFGCTNLEDLETGDPLDFADIGTTEARMRSPLGTVDFDYDTAATAFFQNALTADDVGAGVEWTLDNVDSDEGVFFVQKFISMPTRLDFSGFIIDGDVPDSVSRGPFTLTWTPQAGAQWVSVQLQLEQGSTITESAACMAEVRDGTLAIPEDIWDDLDEADGMYVLLGSTNETATKIEGVYGASHMGASWYQAGYVRFE